MSRLSRIVCIGLILGAGLAGCRREAPPSSGVAPSPVAQATPAATPSPEMVAPAPAKFTATFLGTIDGRLNVQVELERNGADLSGAYFYERAGAMNLAEKTLTLKGKIDRNGSVTLGETVYNAQMDKEQRTGEFTGRLEAVSTGGEPLLRFTGAWTGARDSRPLNVVLRELRFDLGGLKLADKRATQASRKLNYRLQTSLPQLTGADAARADKFNQAVADLLAARTGEFKKLAEEMSRDDAQLAAQAAPAEKASGPAVARSPYEMEVRYTVAAASPDFISILFFVYEYTGGAHPNTTTTAFNYDLTRNQPVRLADLFDPKADHLKILSEYSIRELKKLKTVDGAEEGAGPKAENFASWNITPGGLRITFDRYQVAAYAAGDHEVLIPFAVLKPIARPDGLLGPFVR